MKKFLIPFIASAGFLLAAIPAFAATPLSGYAWSSNIGWLSFNSSDGGTVQLATTTGSSIGTLSGYAWSSNIGWVSFNRGVTGSPPSNDPGNGVGAIATVDMTTGAVSGWMRALAGCQYDLLDMNGKCTGVGPGNANGTTITSSNTQDNNNNNTVACQNNHSLAAQSGAGSRTWTSITSSANGSMLAAGTYNGYIYTSSDCGVTWTAQTLSGQHYWSSVTSSSDGKYLAATDFGGRGTDGYIYTSTDYGVHWTQQTTSGLHHWTGIASSADGSRIVAVTSGDQIGCDTTVCFYGDNHIYTSTDYGSHWTANITPLRQVWSSVTSSSNGMNLAATVIAPGGTIASTPPIGVGYIYTSTDGGATWKQSGSPPLWWTSIASSADGMKLVASDSGGYYYEGWASYYNDPTIGPNLAAIFISSDGVGHVDTAQCR